MKLTPEFARTASEIDYELRSERLTYILRDGDRYAHWYGTLLSTLTLLVGTNKLVYTQSAHDDDAGTVTFALFTAQRVIDVRVTGVGENSENAPAVSTRVVPRSTLTSLAVTTSLPIDVEGTAEYAWPGNVEIRATYAGLPDTVLLRGPGAISRDPQVPAPILLLLEGLQQDLSPSLTPTVGN